MVEWLEKFVGQGNMLRVAVTLSLFAFFLILKVVIDRASRKVSVEPDKRFRLRKMGGYVTNVLFVFALFHLWSSENWSLASFVGLLSAGLAFILREPLLNLAGWVFLLGRKPFELGDRIQVGEQIGDVVDIGLNDFTLMEIGNWVQADQSTGRILHVPNSVVFTNTVANYQQGFPFLWDEIPVLLTYHSNWQKAKAIMESVIEQQSEVDREDRKQALQDLKNQDRYLIYFRHLTPIVYVSKDSSGILLTLRYLCAPRRRRHMENLIWTSIFTRFAQEDDLEFAYPTRRWVGERDNPLFESVEKKSATADAELREKS